MAANVGIRPANRNDMTGVMEMIQELADFEKMPDGPKVTAKILQRDCFDTVPPLFQCYVAEMQKDDATFLIGYSIFFNIYSTWEGKSMMLEDLYIKPEHRRCGAGKLMFKTIGKLAVDTGCCRLDFHVLKWNPARQFYESLGAVNLTGTEEWLFYRLTGNELSKMAA